MINTLTKSDCKKQLRLKDHGTKVREAGRVYEDRRSSAERERKRHKNKCLQACSGGGVKGARETSNPICARRHREGSFALRRLSQGSRG